LRRNDRLYSPFMFPSEIEEITPREVKLSSIENAIYQK
jgi:hypothetical protein